MASAAPSLMAAIVTVCAVIAVAGCGHDAVNPGEHAGHDRATPDAVSTIHNSYDVAFAQNMIPHHQQAVDMSAMVPENSTNHGLILIAQHISSDQQAEIRTLEGLLARWNESTAAHHGSHDGGMGMVDSETMKQLGSLHGGAFDALWVRSMIGHHQGAVMMAQTEIAHGASPDAKNLAGIMIKAQQREISQLNQLISASE